MVVLASEGVAQVLAEVEMVEKVVPQVEKVVEQVEMGAVLVLKEDPQVLLVVALASEEVEQVLVEGVHYRTAAAKCPLLHNRPGFRRERFMRPIKRNANVGGDFEKWRKYRHYRPVRLQLHRLQ